MKPACGRWKSMLHSPCSLTNIHPPMMRILRFHPLLI